MSSTTKASESSSAGQPEDGQAEDSGAGSKAKLAGAWLVVGVPLVYGLYETALKATALFTS